MSSSVVREKTVEKIFHELFENKKKSNIQLLTKKSSFYIFNKETLFLLLMKS
jgi:hypothetical protein